MSDADNPLVRSTGAGQVEGFRSEGTFTWRGIPFAASTAGKNRYKAPQPVESWQDKAIKQCKDWGPCPPQVTVSGLLGVGPFTQVSEDCLHLNVIAPEGSKKGDNLPVVIWIYGGGFMVGSNSATYNDGTNLSREGKLVFVAMNYRVNAFGCQSFSSFNTDEHTFETNCGLKDQIAAMKWVQANVANFGGDPGDVTLFAESAGAASIAAHYCIAESEPLFQRGFLLSASVHMVAEQAQADYFARQVVKKLGVDPDDKEAAAKALMSKSWKQVLAASDHISIKVQPEDRPGSLAQGPIIEPGFLDASVLDTFAQGKQQKKPLVLCNQSCEGSLFTVALPVLPISKTRAERMFQLTSCSEEQIAQLRKVYDLEKNAKKGYINLGGDSTFWHGSILLAEAHSEAGAPVWYHMNEYAPPLLHKLGFGCTHLLGDIWLYLGNVNKNLGRLFTLNGFWGQKDALNVSKRMQGHLLNFVRSSTPVKDAKQWPQYDVQDRATLVTHAEKDEVSNDYRKDRREAWGQWRSYAKRTEP